MAVFQKLFMAEEGKAVNGGQTLQEAIQWLGGDAKQEQKFLEKILEKIEQELKAAKKHHTKFKHMALQALKYKKRYEKQLTQINGSLSSSGKPLRMPTPTLSCSTVKAMKAVDNNMDNNKVEKLMQGIHDQQELAEIYTAIYKPVGLGEEVDQDKFMAELEELEQEELDNNFLVIGGLEIASLPNVFSVALLSKPTKKRRGRQ